MERGIAMKGRYLLLLIASLMLLLVSYVRAVTPRTLVLAASADSTVPALSLQEARKLFLGVPLLKAGENPVALLNTSDPLAFQVFLQKVAFMSANTYETQTMSVVFRLGGKRPENYNDFKDLIDALQHNPESVTFLWDDQVKANQGLKSLSVLWQETPE